MVNIYVKFLYPAGEDGQTRHVSPKALGCHMAAAQMLPPPPKAKAPATKAKMGEALRLRLKPDEKGP